MTCEFNQRFRKQKKSLTGDGNFSTSDRPGLTTRSAVGDDLRARAGSCAEGTCVVRHGRETVRAREAEKQLRGVQPVPPRQTITHLFGLQPVPPRQAEKELRGV